MPEKTPGPLVTELLLDQPETQYRAKKRPVDLGQPLRVPVTPRLQDRHHLLVKAAAFLLSVCQLCCQSDQGLVHRLDLGLHLRRAPVLESPGPT